MAYSFKCIFRLILFSLILILSVVYWDNLKIIWINHYIIVTFIYLLTLFILLIFSNEYLNIQPIPTNNYEPKYSDFSPRIGGFLDNYMGSNWDKLIRLVTVLNLIIIFCFNEFLTSSSGGVLTAIYYLTRFILVISLSWGTILAAVAMYMVLCMLLKSRPNTTINNDRFKHNYNN